MRKRARLRVAARIQAEGLPHFSRQSLRKTGLHLVPVTESPLTKLFDAACDELHYAGSCRRVGRKLRLGVVVDGEWAGGIVLGSPFPNIQPRDDALGLTRWVKNWQERGLVSPWARENTEYWSRLQLVVNHARTYIFPDFEGAGVGVEAHRALVRRGLSLWRKKYSTDVKALDTLCTHPESRLFLDNGWKLVGRTKGYTRDPDAVLSKRAFKSDWDSIRENAGLRLLEGGDRWWIWVRKV